MTTSDITMTGAPAEAEAPRQPGAQVRLETVGKIDRPDKPFVLANGKPVGHPRQKVRDPAQTGGLALAPCPAFGQQVGRVAIGTGKVGNHALRLPANGG